MSAQIGLEIKLQRERLKLSAKDLAEKIGLSPSQMSRLETGQRRVDAVVLAKIARALEVHPSHFFQDFERIAAEPVAPPDGTDSDESLTPAEGVARDAAPATGRAARPALLADVPAHLGRIVRGERHRRHFTPDDLAEKIGKARTFVLDLEAGQTEHVSGEVLGRLARALKLDPIVLLEAQRAEIRDLKKNLARLERAHTDRTLGELELEGPAASRRGLPLVAGEDGGLPWRFDGRAPAGPVADYLYVPGLRVQQGFAVVLQGTDMEAPTGPSFRSGALLVFASDREPRHRDLVLAVLRERSVFRQLFLDPKGRVRLQALNVDVPPLILERDEVVELFLLVAHISSTA